MAGGRWMDSDNLVARLNLPNMRWPPERKIDVYAHAVRGLLSQEADVEKRLSSNDGSRNISREPWRLSSPASSNAASARSIRR